MATPSLGILVSEASAPLSLPNLKLWLLDLEIPPTQWERITSLGCGGHEAGPSLEETSKSKEGGRHQGTQTTNEAIPDLEMLCEKNKVGTWVIVKGEKSTVQKLVAEGTAGAKALG